MNFPDPAWKRVLKTACGAGDIIVERNSETNRTRFILIENHGLHMEIRTFDGDYTGPVEFEATARFVENLTKKD